MDVDVSKVSEQPEDEFPVDEPVDDGEPKGDEEVKKITVDVEVPADLKFAKAYVIGSNNEESLKKIEKFLAACQSNAQQGHSGSVEVFVDGDGSFDLRVIEPNVESALSDKDREELSGDKLTI